MSEGGDMHILVTDQTGQEHRLDALEGWSAMEIMRDFDLNIKAECGGCMSCATCHVYVDTDWLEKLYPPPEEETDILENEAFAVQENSRLSCQILFTEELNGLKLTLAPGTEKDA
jgi:2Fe-2S ferredoxin